MPDAEPTRPCGRFRQAVVATGHMVDLPDRPAPRFRQTDVPAVTRAVADALARWEVGPGTLVVSGGARGADIIAAEQALTAGAEVWLLVVLPEDRFVEASVAMAGTDWEERFRRLRSRCPTWFQPDHLGPPGPEDDVFERNNDWCLAVAVAQGDGAVRVVAVWDGQGGDGRGGTGHLVERARALGASVAVIHPSAGTGAPTSPESPR